MIRHQPFEVWQAVTQTITPKVDKVPTQFVSKLSKQYQPRSTVCSNLSEKVRVTVSHEFDTQYRAFIFVTCLRLDDRR